MVCRTLDPSTGRRGRTLLDFFVNGVGVAVGTKLLDFKSPGGVTTVLASGVAGNAVGSLVGISATFCAFHGDGNAYAFLTCHVSL